MFQQYSSPFRPPNIKRGTPGLHKVPHPDDAKIINDPVLGLIRIPGSCIKFVDTVEFQRLRNISQLGTTYFVFPGASHHRFEHCLGVCYLSGLLGERIQAMQPELEVTNHELDLLRIAGLCHDIGHGPFSHVFEKWMRQDMGVRSFDHEKMSCEMLDFLLTRNSIDRYSTGDLNIIKALICGHSEGAGEREWMYQIVHNRKNGVDVDKFDYIARDAYSLGVKTTWDYSRLMTFSKVIGNDICFQRKEDLNVYELFHIRYYLHRQVYTHRVGAAIEYMIRDAFTLADPFLHLKETVDDLATFVSLDDSVLQQIEFSNSSELSAARSLLRRIKERDLYQLVGSCLIPSSDWPLFGKLSPADIAVYNDGLEESDLIVDMMNINYTMNELNPVEQVRFFVDWNDQESFSIPRTDVSLLIPDVFQERLLRVFVRNKKKLELARQAMDQWTRARNLRQI